MKFKFEWHSNKTNNQQNKIIEENIKAEIIHNKDLMKLPAKKLIISIFDIPHSQALKGSAVNSDNVELVSFTYHLSSGDTKYTF